MAPEFQLSERRKNMSSSLARLTVKFCYCYYLWFEYLKRSEKYKTACANNGKGMKKLYKDFGNVFEYEGVEGFWRWWRERGQ
jgi:hypothetical protein